MPDAKYPEHAKLKEVAQRSQAIGEFLDWLSQEKGLYLAVRHEHHVSCCEEGVRRCGYSQGDYLPANVTTRGLLAEFFCINEMTIEKEKRAMLAELRGDDRE